MKRILLSKGSKTCSKPVFIFPQGVSNDVFGWYINSDHSLVFPFGVKYKDRLIAVNRGGNLVFESKWSFYYNEELNACGWKCFMKEVDSFKEVDAIGFGQLYWLISRGKIEILFKGEKEEKLFSLEEYTKLTRTAICWNYTEIYQNVKLFTKFEEVESGSEKFLRGFWIILDDDDVVDFGYRGRDYVITRKDCRKVYRNHQLKGG